MTIENVHMHISQVSHGFRMCRCSRAAIDKATLSDSCFSLAASISCKEVCVSGEFQNLLLGGVQLCLWGDTWSSRVSLARIFARSVLSPIYQCSCVIANVICKYLHNRVFLEVTHLWR